MKKVLIITDHKWRDLAGNVYLKVLLERNDNRIRVRLCRLGEERFWVLHDRPDLLIYNHLYEEKKVRYACWLKTQGVSVMILPTEGMPFKAVEDLAAGKYTDLSPVDLYLSWNESRARKIVELGKLPPERVKVVGVPRFDFYFPPLNRLLPSKGEIQRQHGLEVNPASPVILYATNFTVASFTNQKSFVFKDWESLKLNRVEGYRPDQIEDRIEKDALARNLTLQSVRQLLRDLPGIQVIYKPHPSENHLFYRKIVRDLRKEFPGRFAFVVQEYIWNLLSVADVVLQRACTTALEAWILEKPTLELQLHPQEFYFSQEHSRGSHLVSDYQGVREHVSHYCNGGKVPVSMKENRASVLSLWCHKLDGQRTLTVAKIIGEFLKGRERARYSLSPGDLLHRYPREYLKQLFRYGRNFARKELVGADRLGRIDKQFAEADLEFWKRCIDSVASGV